jgi:hypothetical protein
MICPNCESEYREGFLRCADCNVDLVHPESENFIETNSKHEFKTDSKHELTRVFETQQNGLLLEISLAFENRNIPYLAQSGTAIDAGGIVNQTRNLIWRGALWVPESYEEEATQIIEEVLNELKNLPASE